MPMRRPHVPCTVLTSDAAGAVGRALSWIPGSPLPLTQAPCCTAPRPQVLSQLPELTSPCPESRLLADRLLGEEVAQLDAGAEELLQTGRALMLQVRGLNRVRLGVWAGGSRVPLRSVGKRACCCLAGLGIGLLLLWCTP